MAKPQILDLSGNTIKADGIKTASLTSVTNASTAHALNATFSDTEVEAALNALGTKINQILAALKA